MFPTTRSEKQRSNYGGGDGGGVGWYQRIAVTV